MSTHEFAIIGGGISGLVLAIALHHRNIKVTIYEQAKHFGEIGAGVAFTGNAIQAMKICHPGIHEAFETVCTSNQWETKKDVWFDFYDAYGGADVPEKYAFTIKTSSGHGTAGVHRARFLDEMIKLLPEGSAHFNKKLDTLSQDENNRWHMKFFDGSTSTADAVIGCDGIKSRVRQLLYGEDHPCAFPTYTNKYAYRALAKMEDAIKAVGEERAQNSCAHMGEGAHVLTFPVDHGKTMNLVGFVTAKDDWPDHNKLTKPAHREDALRDFKNFGSDVNKLLHLCHSDLDVWAIFHLGDNPLPYYNKGSLCLLGDAAHATSPHHGSGAGMCIEDSAIMAELLASEGITSQKAIEVAFSQFNDLRRERGNWLVQSSNHQGNLYEWLVPGIGRDFGKMEAEINQRNSKIADVNVQQMCDEAKSSLANALLSAQT